MLKLREEVSIDNSFFHNRNWTRISAGEAPRHVCLNGKAGAVPAISVERFYIRDIAMWIPHRLIKDHIPTCPRCERSKFVQPTASWIAKPKILYGIRQHRYLDTIYYKCHSESCEGRSFSGLNEKSLQLDAVKVLGVFNFHLTCGCAVDEELHSYIINHSRDTTAGTHKKLALMATDEWMDDAMFHYTAVPVKQVKTRRSDTLLEDARQRTLHRHLQDVRETPLKKKQRSIKLEMARVDREIAAKRQALEEDVEFISVFKAKANRNSIGLPFRGLGRAKILKLIGLGITSAKELLNYDGGDPSVLPQWICLVENYYDGLEIELGVLSERKSVLQDDLDWNAIAMDIESNEAGDATNDNVQATSDVQELVPPFSPFLDADRYNARVVSKSTIDRIVSTDFQYRKPIMQDKMRSNTAYALKIDWHYKLPGKIKVYTGREKSFSPFKSAVSIKNEYEKTIFWKCYPCSEGVDTMRPDLERLRERLLMLQGELPRVAYVDNCCQVRAKLQQIFGDELLVLLDCFHWCKRWDLVLKDSKSAEASVFRGMVHNALFVVETSEFNRAKFVLQSKLKRTPNTKEILKEAKATIPEDRKSVV